MFKFIALLIVNVVVTAAMLCCALPVVAGDIHTAIEAGDVARVKQLIADNPSIILERADNRFSELPIHIAAQTGNIEIARLLLDAGADIDAGDSDNSTALGVAAMRKHGDLVAFLIQRGANVNHRDRKADCPLSFAVYGRDEAIIQQLLDAGADLYFQNPSGETLLHIASARGVARLVTHLLEHGAYIEARPENGATPLGYAALQGHADIVRLLLDHGANPNPDSAEGVTPLIFTAWRNQIECARSLLESGADPNLIAPRNDAALLAAADNASAEMIALLIEHGASVDHRNDAGETAVVKASMSGYADRVAPLLAAGADPNLGTDAGGRTALQLAAICGHVEVARLLLDAGAKVNAPSPAGETAIQLAHYYGNEDLAALLAERGAKNGDRAPNDRSLAAIGNVDDGEAVVWFLGHSGWAVKTANHLLIFDYFSQGAQPASAGLSNGHINPSEIKDCKVAVFASHQHGDHFTPAIFEWKQQANDITYFLGLQPQDAPAYEFMPERLEKDFGDMKLTTIKATDAGVGMVIDVDGVTIFHAGDHANGRIGLMDAFTDEIDFLAAKKIRPDICFMGIRGCSLGTPDQVKEGVYYALKTLKPRAFIPMHAGAQGQVYREFNDECRKEFASIQMVAPGNRGDHFVSSNGTITDPRSAGVKQARSH